MPVEVEEEIFKGIVGLHGGTAQSGVGTCGAISAACFLISYVVGVTSEELAQNSALSVTAALPAVIYVIDRFEGEYGAIDCLRLRYNRVQRAFDFWILTLGFGKHFFTSAKKRNAELS